MPSAVKLNKKAWVGAQTLMVMGVDPGLASTGVAILEKSPNQKPICRELNVVRTKKADKKDRRGLRVTADDSRRLREVWNGLTDMTQVWQPQVLAFEVYSPYGAQGGSAWKTARVEGAIQMFGLERGMLVLPFLPMDLKRGFCGRANASKQDVLFALAQKVENLEQMVQTFSKTLREHVADAAGHAYLAFEEVYRMRAMLGF
jgi:Holliday junction resolvasome RuvABC endonuclease subunit